MNIREYVINKAIHSREAAREMSTADTCTKNGALIEMADALLQNIHIIIEANKKDLANGKKKGLSIALMDRLLLNEKRIHAMADGLKKIVSLTDPVGEGIRSWKNSDNLEINQISVPLGVIGIIYEARPNVTIDAAGLCVKSGNSVILRGGSEAIHSNTVIADILSTAAIKAGLPHGVIQLLENTDREAVNVLMKLNEFIDVIIPRGGASLINAVVQNATVPVIETGVGNCHIYVDNNADLSMAENIILNAKTQRPGVCNAAETLLIHKSVANVFLPKLSKTLSSKNVELRGCGTSQSIVTSIKPASEDDWFSEYLDYILAIKVVDSIDVALDHIYKYGTKHSEAIITNNYDNAQRFLNEVDAAAVYVNASTRFTDGEKFGFGAEIGISTQKLHARGPMGLKELTTSKYMIYGQGQIRK